MDNKIKTKIFITMYIAALRAVYKNQFLRPPVEGSKKYEQLDKARQIVEEMGGDFSDYIHVQFQAFRRLKGLFAPKPEHLVSEGAIKRYKIFQMRKNKYKRETYTINGDKFIVQATGKSYPFYRVELPADSDMDALYAILVASKVSDSKMGEDEKERALEAIEYFIAKLSYKGKMPTNSLLQAREKLKE